MLEILARVYALYKRNRYIAISLTAYVLAESAISLWEYLVPSIHRESTICRNHAYGLMGTESGNMAGSRRHRQDSSFSLYVCSSKTNLVTCTQPRQSSLTQSMPRLAFN